MKIERPDLEVVNEDYFASGKLGEIRGRSTGDVSTAGRGVRIDGAVDGNYLSPGWTAGVSGTLLIGSAGG